MGYKKISQLPELTKPSGSNIIPIVSSGTTYKIQLDNLLDYNVPNTTIVSGSTYTFGEYDSILSVSYTLTGSCAITLPTAQISIDGRIFEIQDKGLNCYTNNITISTQAAELIQNENDLIMNIDGTSITLYSDGNNLYIK